MKKGTIISIPSLPRNDIKIKIETNLIKEHAVTSITYIILQFIELNEIKV